MKYTVQNLAYRPVSLVGNSGKAFHLPPKYSGEFDEVEIKGNAMIEKLQGRKILSVAQAKSKDNKAEASKSESKSSKTSKTSAKSK